MASLERLSPDRKRYETLQRVGEILLNPRNLLGNNHALFTGNGGIAFTLLYMQDLLNEKKQLLHAKAILLQSESLLSGPIRSLDLLNGMAGTLLGLAHFYAATKDPDILSLISKFIKHILAQTIINKYGISWEESEKHIRPLCGISHGAGGIGWVLMEVGAYFRVPELVAVATETFKYENAFYDRNECNWPDYRKGIYDVASLEELKKRFVARDYNHFYEPNFMTAWCHGAPGIGLTRLRAYELTGNKVWLNDYRRAAKKTARWFSERNSFWTETLCHGELGNATIFLEGYKVLKEKKLLAAATDAANRTLSRHAKTGGYRCGYSIAANQEDAGLFLGNSGIGHYYLSLIKPDLMSPLLLSLPKRDSKTNKLDLKADDVSRLLYRSLYPSMSEVAKGKINLKSSVSLFSQMRSLSQNLSKKKGTSHGFEFSIDQSAILLKEKIKSAPLEQVRFLVSQYEISNKMDLLEGEIFNDQNLRLKGDARLVVDLKSDRYAIVIKRSFKVKTFVLQRPEYLILASLKKRPTVNLLHAKFSKSIAKEELETLLREYCKQGVVELY